LEKKESVKTTKNRFIKIDKAKQIENNSHENKNGVTETLNLSINQQQREQD